MSAMRRAAVIAFATMVCPFVPYQRSYVSGVLAFSFGGGRNSRRHSGSGGDSSSSSSSLLKFTLDDDDEEYAINKSRCGDRSTVFAETIRGGSTKPASLSEPTPTATEIDEIVTQKIMDDDNNDSVSPILIKTIHALQGAYFWNDSLQSLAGRLNVVRKLKRTIGLLSDDDNEAPKDVEAYADNDEITTLFGYTKEWKVPDNTALIGGSANGNKVRASAFRTNTLFEQNENTGMIALVVGPYKNKHVPSGGQSVITSTVMSGVCSRNGPSSEDASSLDSNTNKPPPRKSTPFASANIQTKCTVPLLSGKRVEHDTVSRGVTLVMDHHAGASTTNLPRHLANKMGYLAHRVRDYKQWSMFDTTGSRYLEYKHVAPVSSLMQGTIELQVTTNRLLQNSFVSIFGDWSFAKRLCRCEEIPKEDSSLFSSTTGMNSWIRSSCVGANIVAAPFMVGVSFSEDGKAGITFGLTAGLLEE